MLTSESRQRDFPSLTGRCYLNSAAEGIPPLSVGVALQQYFQDKLLGMDGRIPHAQQWEAAKALVADFYGLSPGEISICSCSSEAYNLAAMALNLQPGDEVVINDLDFPAGATPWLQPSCPAKVRVWKNRDWLLRLEDLLPLLNSHTRFVNLSLVSYFNGFTIPLQEWLPEIRKRTSARVAVDVTQALGRIPLDLKGVDLIISSTHKWILASHGGGLVGVPSAKSSDWVVPAGGWFHLRDAFGPKRFETAETIPGAPGFTVGMPNYPAVYAIRAGLEYIRSVGVDAIAKATRPLVQQCLEGLKKLPVDLITRQQASELAGIISILHPKAEEIRDHLRSQQVHVMGSVGRLRIAIHGYNTAADIDHLLACLNQAIRVS